MKIDFIAPEWSAPKQVRAAFTLRLGGASAGPFESLNLGAHVGDDLAAVTENRRRLRAALALPNEPVWLEQVHGVDVADLDQSIAASPPTADAAVARAAGEVCVVQVADCMPVLFASSDGKTIGAAHAGWRGLANGVLETTVKALGVVPAQVHAWLGPAIGPTHFEVGPEVRAAFLAQNPHASAAFAANPRGRWQCDLRSLARMRLEKLGVRSVTGGHWCTHADPKRFFSFRRDGRCGRMAALIWIDKVAAGDNSP